MHRRRVAQDRVRRGSLLAVTVAVAGVLASVLASCAPSPAGTTGGPTTSIGPRPFQMIVLGDSLSSAPEVIADRARWQDLVANQLAAPSGVQAQLTDGLGGWNRSNRGGPPSLEHWDATWGGFTSFSYVGKPWMYPPVIAPDLLIVALGANDIAVNASPSLYAAGLRGILDHYADQACVITFPWWPAFRPSVATWSAAAASVAAERSCEFVDLGATIGAPLEGITSRDDIHPNVLGHQLWAEAIGSAASTVTGRG